MSRMPKSNRYIFTEEERAKINAACESTTNESALRRLEVLRLRANEKSYAEITQATGYKSAHIWRILKRYKEDGLEPIANEPLTGKRKYNATNYEFTPEQIAELQKGYRNASDPYVARRFRALLLRSEGKTIREAAEATNFSVGNISVLIKAYRKHGARAVGGKAQPARVYKHGFTAEQKHEIAEARKTVTDKRAVKRLEALWQRAEGKMVKEAAAAAGLHPTTVTYLIRKCQEQGLDSIIKSNYKKQSHPNYGHQYLSYEKESDVLEQFRIKAEQGRYVAAADIKAALETEIGRPVSRSYTMQILKRHQWTLRWMPPGTTKKLTRC